MNLAEFNHQYQLIIESHFNSKMKSKMLVALMNEMEKTFNIPMIRKPEYDKQNGEVIALYRKVSNSRTL